MSGTGLPANLRDANGNWQIYEGRVAVIVGAGTDVGRALAAKLAGFGMKLVLADADADTLEQAADTLQAAGADVLAMVCDVGRRAHVEELADAALIRFHGIHLLVNGAAAGLAAGPGLAWELDDVVWDAALGAGVQGAANAVRVFTPLMLACAAREPGYRGHVVNVVPPKGNAAAAVQAEGIAALTDALVRDLRQAQAPVGVSLLRLEAGITANALTDAAIAALSGTPANGRLP